jgi:hypothetical protein
MNQVGIGLPTASPVTIPGTYSPGLAAMGLPQRDAQHHTYGDYLAWPEDLRYELIDGVAYLKTPASSRPLAAYERAGVPEVWFIHPTDRLLTIYRLEIAARYGRPLISELKGQTAISSVPDLSIDWDRMLAQLDG